MIWSLIGSIGGKVLDIVDNAVEDKDEANSLKFEIKRQLIENKSSELEAAAKIGLGGSSRLMAPAQLATLVDGHLCWPRSSPLVWPYRSKHPRNYPELVAQHRHGWRWRLRRRPFW